MPTHTKVEGHCPACGNETLFVASGGYLTCSLIACPNPTALADILEEGETQHIVKIEDDKFTIRHPLIERVGSDLMDCTLHAFLVSLGGPPAKPGTYRAHWSETTGAAGGRFLPITPESREKG